MSSKGRCSLPALTGLRFFLALWVILYHQIPHEDNTLAVSWLGNLPLPFHLFLRTGYAAVTVFFVLSGFVLAYNYDLGATWSRQKRLRFWIARFARIYPAYFAGLLLMAPFLLYRSIILKRSISLAYEALTALLNFALVQSWHPAAALTWNYPGWSLSGEAFFYAVFPFIGIWLWRLQKPLALIGMAAILWVLSMAPSWVAVVWPIPGFGDVSAAVFDIPEAAGFAANLIRYNPLLRLAEFAAGILLARLYFYLQSHPNPLKGSWFYMPGLLVTAFVLGQADRIPYPLAHNGLLLPPYACLILGLALNGGWLARWLSWPPLVFLGNASYSMYILHAPIQIWLMILLRRWFSVEPQGLAWVTAYAMVVIVISSLFFVYFEERAHRSLREALRRRFEPTP